MSHVGNGDDVSSALDAVAQAYHNSPSADSGSIVEEAQPELDTGFTDFPEDDNYDVADEPQPTEPTTTEALQC
jgi:hypothetical protein